MSVPTPAMIQAIAELSRIFPELAEKIFKDIYDAPDRAAADQLISLWTKGMISTEKAQAVANHLADHYLKTHKIEVEVPSP